MEDGLAHNASSGSDEPKKPERPVFFTLATVCVVPFVIMAGIAVAGICTKSKALADAFLFTVFLAPVFLVASVGALIFFPLAWFKGPRRRRGWLVLYSLLIAAYWKLLTSFAPW